MQKFQPQVHTACKRDVNFMWLLAGQEAPDHSIIVRFRTGFLADACEEASSEEKKEEAVE